MKDITVDPAALPTADVGSPVAQPITPGVQRPAGAPPPAPTERRLPRSLELRIARALGFTDYTAEVAERVIPIVLLADLSKQQQDEETRSGADYRIFSVDLSVAHSRTPIEGTKDLVMTNIALVALTAAASFSLHVGDRDGIPFGGTGLGVGGGVESSPAEQIALFVTNTAQPAATATLLVSSGVRVSF